MSNWTCNNGSNSMYTNRENTSVSNGACNTGSNSMYKNTENTIVSNGACNTASSNMYKTVKTPMCPTVHVTLDQIVCTKQGKHQCVQRYM